MLFDYRKQTEVVSLDGIKSWLETKNPDEVYRFDNCRGGCLFSQYLTERLGAAVGPPSNLSREVFQYWLGLHERFRPIAMGDGLRNEWTFGAALKRAAPRSNTDA